MNEMICHFRINESTTVFTRLMDEPSTFFHRKETGHYDGLYRIHHIEWNSHANRHEVIYMIEPS